MDEQIPQEPKSNNTATIIIVSVVITALIVGGAVFTYDNIKIDALKTELTSQITQLNKKITELNKINEELSCKGRWTEDEGCKENILAVLSPKSGETFCLEEPIPLKWNVPAGVDTINIGLVKGQATGNLGTFKASDDIVDGIGMGELQWDATYVRGEKVKPGDIYKIKISTFHNKESIEAFSEGLFSIKQCKEAAKIEVVSPNGGELFCLNRTNTIKWTSPPEIDSVRITLITLSSGNALGDFPAITTIEDSVSIGELEWNGKNRYGFAPEPGNAYKISIQTTENDVKYYDESDNLFTIAEKCEVTF